MACIAQYGGIVRKQLLLSQGYPHLSIETMLTLDFSSRTSAENIYIKPHTDGVGKFFPSQNDLLKNWFRICYMTYEWFFSVPKIESDFESVLLWEQKSCQDTNIICIYNICILNGDVRFFSEKVVLQFEMKLLTTVPYGTIREFTVEPQFMSPLGKI